MVLGRKENTLPLIRLWEGVVWRQIAKSATKDKPTRCGTKITRVINVRVAEWSAPTNKYGRLDWWNVFAFTCSHQPQIFIRKLLKKFRLPLTESKNFSRGGERQTIPLCPFQRRFQISVRVRVIKQNEIHNRGLLVPSEGTRVEMFNSPDYVGRSRIWSSTLHWLTPSISLFDPDAKPIKSGTIRRPDSPSFNPGFDQKALEFPVCQNSLEIREVNPHLPGQAFQPHQLIQTYGFTTHVSIPFLLVNWLLNITESNQIIHTFLYLSISSL